ncbi:Beta-1 adrenergic receptor [Trichoplax sp. H2]|nr:Beta-1 adrenergic receptor [Trichoplax sp. H2]|eukprot:RDD36638.1 Beta-1 adrenergic receptor [Trichoplax sp. H2]
MTTILSSITISWNWYPTEYDGNITTRTERPGFRHSDAKFIILIIFSVFISLIAITCNLFNLVVIYKSPALHNMNNLLILNLSFVDFLNGLIGLPLGMITAIIGDPGFAFCQIQGFILVFLYMASLIATSAVSIDRCNAVINPFGYQSSVSVNKSAATTIAQDLARGNLKKSIRITSMIIGTNLVCWLPYVIIGIRSVAYINRDVVPVYRPTFANIISVILIFSNSAINPVIYATTNSYIRKRFCRLLHSNRIQPWTSATPR